MEYLKGVCEINQLISKTK